MDNQQERLAATAYLAGLVDGEGWIGLPIQRRKSHVDGYTIKPCISVHMIGPETIEHVHRLSGIIGIPSYFQHQRGGTSRWSLVGMKRVPRVLNALLPHLFVKRRQAKLVLEFCESRLNWEYGKGYTDREKELREMIGLLNTKGKGKNPQRLYAGQGSTSLSPR